MPPRLVPGSVWDRAGRNEPDATRPDLRAACGGARRVMARCITMVRDDGPGPATRVKGADMDEADVLGLFERCSNVGRWGPDDMLGTLNFVTPARRAAAATLVRSGRIVSLARDLSTAPSLSNPVPVVHRMLQGGEQDAVGSADSIEITSHGYAVTHLDAFGHAYFEGRAHNGRRASEIWSPAGLSYGSIDGLRDGIFTRGVLLDVARARGVAWLTPGEGVSPEDLDRAEAMAGVRVESGDAVIVRIGLGARELVEGTEDPAHRAGLLPECLPWLYEREVSVYGGDCIEQLPSPYPRVPAPFHMVALVAMGLVLLDNPTVEELAKVARELGRSAFLLTCAPLPIRGGTGSPVNPLAVF